MNAVMATEFHGRNYYVLRNEDFKWRRHIVAGRFVSFVGEWSASGGRACIARSADVKSGGKTSRAS